MGKPDGFIEYERTPGRYRPVEERTADYRETVLPVPALDLVNEGARCMECGIPFCHSIGCPVGNLIPDWNDSLYQKNFREAYVRLEMTNNFPEITGKVCPAPCEASCTLAMNKAPVSIRQIESSLIEKAFEEGWVKPMPPRRETGKKIAVIGSGPAGLAAAQQLRRQGHKVSLFERSAKPGGLLRYGIPDFKLDKSLLDRRLEQLQAEGVDFETDVIIGEDLSVRYLKRKHDVIVLALGAGAPRDLPVPGRGFDGIHFAMEYLTLSNRFISGEITERELITARSKNVLVIGGGDTGSDCVGTAIRQGAGKVTQVEILPKPREWKESFNPEWPFWPNILRTSTSHEEGCERIWSVSAVQFSGGYEPWVAKTHFKELEWKILKEGGRVEPVIIPGDGFSLDTDLVLIAMGFVHVEHSRLLEDLGVSFDGMGNIALRDGYMTSVPGIFCAGDAHSGASLVVRAIDHGRQAAEQIGTYLGA